MADLKTTALTALTGANTAPDDVLPIVDLSDTTQGASGTLKKITRQELQTYNAGTLTTDVKVLDLSATWNNAAVTFGGWKLNVTDTASAVGSLLMDLQVGGVSKFAVKKDGNVLAAQFYITATSGIQGDGGANLVFTANGGYWGAVTPIGFRLGSDGALGWSDTAGSPYGGVTDLFLRRDAAGTLAQRNGVNAQTFNLYNTYTDAANYQRLKHGWNTSTALIMNEGAGTGADGNIAFNDAALATTATKGYVMIPSCAGAPTGVPADIPTGQVALHFDSTNNKLFVYDGAWLSTAALV